MYDKILRALLCRGQVMLTVLDTTALVNRAIGIHGTAPRASKLLGGLLTCGAYLASGLKGDKGSVSVTVKAKDGDGAVSVSADAALHVRGYADGACTQSLAGGSLTVVREDGYSTPYVGACDIPSDDVSDILELYFQQSEQIPTAAVITVNISEDGKCQSAGGAVMQLMPEAEDEQIDAAWQVLKRFKEDGGHVAGGADSVYGEYFEKLSCGKPYELKPEYKCNCSEEKIAAVLTSVGREELLKICDELGEVRVHCHYCNKDYVYDRKRIEETF